MEDKYNKNNQKKNHQLEPKKVAKSILNLLQRKSYPKILFEKKKNTKNH